MYTEQAHRMAGPADPGHWVRDALNAEGFSTLLHRLRGVNLWLKGAQNILPRATLLADAHGLRVHSPFFDRALTEWTFGLPSGLLLQGACEKYLLKKAAGLEKAAETPGKEAVGQVTMAQVRAIAERKMVDLNANDLEAACKMIAGSARSMGIEVIG